MIDDFNHNEANYALAIQQGNYRAACWHALRAVRRTHRKDALWLMRLEGSLARRHGN